MTPSTAPIVEISLGGHARKLYYSFRAWHELGVNPLKPSEMEAFLREIDPMKAARFVWAGIVGHQAHLKRRAELDGETPPAVEEWTADRVLDLLDADVFSQIIDAMNKASGVQSAEPSGNG